MDTRLRWRFGLLAVVLLGALVWLVLATASCTTAITVAPVAPPRVCYDKQPPKLLLDPACPSGVCGYTCAPDRWPPLPITATPIIKAPGR